MSAIPMICEKCGGEIEYDISSGKYICSSCNTKYIFTQDTDFEIVAGVLLNYGGVSSVVKVPEGVKRIDEEAFYGSGVENVILPSTLEILNVEIFSDCKDLKKIQISEGTKCICGRIDNRLPYRQIEAIEIPVSVERIMGNPFEKLGVRSLIIKHELGYYFEMGEYSISAKECFRNKFYDMNKYPWICESIEIIVTPTKTIDYKRFSEERNKIYTDAVQKVRNQISIEKQKIREKREEEIINREIQMKIEREERKKRKNEEIAVAKRANSHSGLSIVAFVFAIFSLIITPLGAIAFILGLLDLIIPSERGRKKSFAIISIITGSCAIGTCLDIVISLFG